jgi:hypothetical protein
MIALAANMGYGILFYTCGDEGKKRFLVCVAVSSLLVID